MGVYIISFSMIDSLLGPEKETAVRPAKLEEVPYIMDDGVSGPVVVSHPMVLSATNPVRSIR